MKIWPEHERVYLNCGVGQDSMALIVLLVEGRLDPEFYKPGVEVDIVFSDPGDENPLTYAYLEDVLIPYCERNGLEFHWLLPGSRYHVTKPQGGHPGRVIGDIISTYMADKKPSFPMLGSGGRCTETHKQNVLARFRTARRKHGWDANQMTRAGYRDVVIVGIAADETSRALPSPSKNYEIVYPLIDMGLTRDGCQKVIEDAGLPLPVKSGCACCPFQPAWAYWWYSQRFPDRFARLAAMEQKHIDYRMARRAAGENTEPQYVLHSLKAPLPRAVEIWYSQNRHVTIEMAEGWLYKKHFSVRWGCSSEVNYLDWGFEEELAKLQTA